MRYGMFNYETENIGDEIQSIAARRFLPHIDEYVNRDEIGTWSPTEQTKIITNGWFMHPPYQWPPKSDAIDPLLISMYVDQSDPSVTEAFLSEESRSFFSAHGPVGARDLSTMDFLKKNGVDSYFSGCMTLTLQADPGIVSQDYVLAVDVPGPVVDMIREKTKRPVIESSPYFDARLNVVDRFELAEYFLYLYQSAHAVVTTRLHAMLPSLALGTPVFLVKDHRKYDPARYAGLDVLVHGATDSEYLEDYSLFDVDNPPENMRDYLELRESLIDKASAFTSFNNETSFRTVDFTQIASNESYIRLFTKGFHSLNTALLLQGDKDWLEEQKRDLEARLELSHNQLELTNAQKRQEIMLLQQQISELHGDIEKMRNSREWKLGQAVIGPLRNLKARIQGKTR